jgi:hypothetical protein
MAGTPPVDGRLPSQPLLTTPLGGTELMYIVSPGNNLEGVSYSITTDALAAFFAAFPALNTSIVTSGASYPVKTTDTSVLINKTLGSATTVLFPAALSMLYDQTVLIKDLKGDAGTNPITINFTGVETCDGLTSGQIIINNPYGWVRITPVPGASAWYMS